MTLPQERSVTPSAKARLLIVDDSENFCWIMQRTFEQRGYEVRVGYSVTQACEMLRDWVPGFAVVDLRMPGAAGLELIPRVKAANPSVRLVVLTAYASIATAIEAIKLGATHYLTKPVDADAIEAAFARANGDPSITPTEQHLSVDRLAWEHIQQVLAEYHGNISATARALSMHRRTLQRKLGKFPVRR
jgi:two-component system response regulator RegA